MKKLLTIILMLVALPTWAADYYIAQTAAGSGNGASCDNADAIADLTWGTGNMVEAGDTLHLCGTLTSTLTIGASGSAGNPITVMFESGSKFSKAAWGTGSSSAIYASGKDYITIDGNNVGVIENTDNGSPNTTTPAGSYGTQQQSNGIVTLNCDNLTIKNLTVKELYNRVPNSNDSNRYGRALVITGSNNALLDNLTVSDAEYGLMASSSGANADGFTISNSSFSRMATGLVITLGSAHDFTNVVVDNVTIFDLYVWDGCWNSCTVWNHNDGIHTWGNYGSGANKLQLTVKNSTIGGDLGSHTSGFIYLSDYTSDVQIYNNVLYTTAEKPALGYIALHAYASGTAKIYNNTIRGAAANNTGGTGIHVNAGTWDLDIQNNIFSTVYVGISGQGATITSDYNNFYNLDTVGYGDSTWYSALSQWRTYLGGCPGVGNECNSLNQDPKFTSTYDFTLQSDSPVINAGTDLSTTFTTDLLGNTRTGTWDMGAYEYGSGEGVTTLPHMGCVIIGGSIR